MTLSRDHQHLDDLDLDDDWTGELVLTDERPDTALTGDPRDRKWMLIGLGIAGVLAVGFVLVASLGNGEAAPVRPAAPSVAIEPAEVPGPIEATPAPAPQLAAAPPKAKFEPKPRKPPPVPELPLTTFASGTRAAVQHAEPPAAKPAPAPAPVPATAPVPAPPAPTLAPPSPEASAAPAGDALPDVQPWDDADADAEALHDLSDASEPG